MENKPLLSDNRSYGLVNPGYVATAETAPGMFAPPGPSAPPASMFDNMPGYEGTIAGERGGFLPPPMPMNPVPPPQPGPEQPHWNIPSITEDTARDAFTLYVSSKCCYSSGPAKDGIITNMKAFNTYRYRLETFNESRSTQWAHEPYHGQPVDAYTQSPPGPWDIPAKAPGFFQDSKKVIKVPYTSSIKSCHNCLGKGRQPCKTCAGSGNKACWVCNGSGVRPGSGIHHGGSHHGESHYGGYHHRGTHCGGSHHYGNNLCLPCNGRGRNNCNQCHGQGSTQCSTCHGKQQLLVYINLTIKWTNNSNDYIVEQSSGLQMSNLSKVTGKKLFRDSQYLVYPVKSFPDVSVVNAAQRLISEHQGRFSQTSRILQQRQTIELIPVSKVTYSWKGESYIYFVYGNELHVHTDDYPATCCCSVM